MKSPERQALEEVLKTEPVGSAKIQALADYALLKNIEYAMQTDSGDLFELRIRKVVLELAIQQHSFSKDASVYMETFDNAAGILAGYFQEPDNPAQRILDDLKEINRGKAGRSVKN